MALHEYLATEVGEDWADGIITRREALRRLGLLGLSAIATITLLEACAPASTASPGVTSIPTGSAQPPASGAPGESPEATGEPATSPAAIDGAAITFPGPIAELQWFLASAATPRGAMLVIHENRGLNDHTRSVASRLAADGYSALAIDLLSEEGGSQSLAQGDIQAALSNASTERLVGDMKAGLDELERRVPARSSVRSASASAAAWSGPCSMRATSVWRQPSRSSVPPRARPTSRAIALPCSACMPSWTIESMPHARRQRRP